MTPDATKCQNDSRKRSKTRKLLVDAALRLFARHRVDQVSINEIAAEADVAHGTVYNYFRSRDDVLEAICIRLVDDISEQIVATNVVIADPAERISRAIRLTLAAATSHPDWGWLLLRFLGTASNIDAVVQRASDDLRAGLACGRFRYGVESAALTLVSGGILMGLRPIVGGWVQPNHEAEVARLVLTGLGVPPAEAARIVALPMSPIPAIPMF